MAKVLMIQSLPLPYLLRKVPGSRFKVLSSKFFSKKADFVKEPY
jgi:hypothetical protein